MVSLRVAIALSLSLAVLLPVGSAHDAVTEDYGFLWWAHGFRQRSPEGKRLLCVRTNRYGMALDVERLQLAHFGPVGAKPGYEQAVVEPNDTVMRLPAGKLEIAIRSGAATYRCVRAASQSHDDIAYPIRIIEQGRYVQRFDIHQLEFADDAGGRLDCEARLEVTAWPDRVAFLIEATPRVDLTDGALGIETGEAASQGAIPSAAGARGVWKAGETRSAYVVRKFGSAEDDPSVQVIASDLGAGSRPLDVSVDHTRGWTRIELPAGDMRPDRDFDHLDRYRLELRNPGSSERVIRLMFARDAPFAGITGMAPILRDSQGRPTGAPVQISKNWHRQPDRRLLYEGPWFHGFTMLRLAPRSKRTLELTIAYARWGGVPAASHAQLCLIGWGVNQLWDQAAIGSWGESICYDPDVNLNRSMIDDIRPLMVTRMGTGDGKWGWTNNVGGGDFLVVVDRAGRRLPLTRMRTAYLSQGPNLTRVVYAGQTPGGEIEARLEVSTPRTDDINRAYHRLRYTVRKPIEFRRLAFYQVGADNYNDHRFGKMAYGNVEGLADEWAVAAGGRKYHRTGIALPGVAPWVSLHEGINGNPQGGAWAVRGLVVRRWKARLGGKPVLTPYLASYGTENGPHSANAELAPPTDVDRLLPGDFVEAELELVILPMAAADYYGPDSDLRAALTNGANTWRMVHREARGNDLRVRALNGQLMRRTPIEIRSRDGRSARFEVTGGLGYVPITFSGLRSAAPFTLTVEAGGHKTNVDQSVHGNDWYQVTREASSGAWAVTVNLPLGRYAADGKPVRVTLAVAAQTPPPKRSQPRSRPFRMGFTPWPSELSLKGIKTAEEFIGKHGDLVSLMFIGGVPWQEALDGKPFSADVQRQFAYKPPRGHRLFLSISPLNMGRNGLAPYWGERDNMPLPAEWARLRFNDPKVIRALTSFALRAVAALKPDWLAIGVESNALLSHDRAVWRDYKELHRSVYAAVKRRHPKLPVFFTTEVNHYLERASEARGSGQEREVADLMRHSDMFAMSYYPHMSYDTRWPIPAGFFDFARRFRKPIAVSETGMLSKEVTVTGLKLRGDPADQRQYYETLLTAASRDRYRFVVTFCTTDYDRLLPALPGEAREIANIWTYTGLQTSDGSPKPALAAWDSWFRIPRGSGI